MKCLITYLIISQVFFTSLLSSEKIEVSLVQKVEGGVQYKVMKAADVDKYCAKAEAAKVGVSVQ